MFNDTIVKKKNNKSDVITSINSCRYMNVQGTRPSQPLTIESESNKVPAAISLVNISKEI